MRSVFAITATALLAMDGSFATPHARQAASCSAIPFDKTYAQLNEEEKRLAEGELSIIVDVE